MNEFETVTASQIDQLVDGELTSIERRAVLISLDHETDGWRRLALAFLESQAVRQTLRHVLSQQKAGSTGVAPEAESQSSFDAPRRDIPRKASDKTRKKWQPVLALAMCSLLMFGLGRMSLLLSGAPRENRPLFPGTYASADPRNANETPSETLIADANVPDHVQQALRLSLNDDSGIPLQTIDVPVVDNPKITPEELMWAPPVISEDVQRALLRSGRRVHEQRQLYDVTFQDGRHGLLPISEVMVEDAGWDVYQ